jgi:uncharacterized phage-associated protein
MADVFDIDTHLRHILEPQHGTLGNVRRHKLCYGVLRKAIEVTGDSPFAGRVLAWPLGPVFVDLWKHPDRDGDPNNIPAPVRAVCATVAEQMGGVPGTKLAASSHRRYPEWRIAREGLRESQCGKHEITREMIRSLTYDQRLTCGAEWHLRDNPRAFVVYSLAIDLAEDGNDPFTMSKAEVAKFFGWDIKTVRSAFAVLLASGWFATTADADAFRIVPHSELYQSAEHCWPGKGE